MDQATRHNVQRQLGVSQNLKGEPTKQVLGRTFLYFLASLEETNLAKAPLGHQDVVDTNDGNRACTPELVNIVNTGHGPGGSH